MGELRGRPVIFGEVLFDRFEDGTAVLGGAPFNVAWHLQGFGMEPLFVSRVGEDALGEQVREAMAAWGMDTAGLQRDAAHPTGTVEVTLHQGQPSYEIVADRAYDFVDTRAAVDAVSAIDPALIYHGSLATRNAESARALERIRDHAALPVFLDLNLRAPWWDAERIERLAAQARWLKLNEDELATTLDLQDESSQSRREAGTGYRARLGLELLIVTSGGDGACLIGEDATRCQAPPPLEDIIDTVGAGDAFSAVALLGLVEEWPHETILARALQFAGDVCRQRGATAHDPELYHRLVQDWSA